MMHHDEIREKLFDLYDRPLTEWERQLVEGHLPDCAECRQTFEEWQKISRALFPHPALSESSEDLFVSKVMARVSSYRPKNVILSWEIALRWLVPLLGSTIAAAWVFFSVLPDTPGLSSENSPALFSESNPEITSANWSVIPVTSSNEEIVVSYLK
jgi:anti-sigma factor RsiW